MYQNDTAFIFENKTDLSGIATGQSNYRIHIHWTAGVRKKTTFHEQSITKPMWQLQRRLTQHEPFSILIRIACMRMSFGTFFHIKPYEF